MEFGNEEILVDLKRLWAAAHGYLLAQNGEDVPALSAAYATFVDEHNAIYARYIRPDERPLSVAGAA